MILGPISDGEGSWRAFERCRAIHWRWGLSTRQPPRIAGDRDVGPNQGEQPPLAGVQARRDGHIWPRRSPVGATRPGARSTGGSIGNRLMRTRAPGKNFKTSSRQSGLAVGRRQ